MTDENIWSQIITKIKYWLGFDVALPSQSHQPARPYVDYMNMGSTVQNSFATANQQMAPMTGEVKSGVEYQRMIKNYKSKNTKQFSHEEIIALIQNNIYYLERLSKAMSKSIYVMEYDKVNQLLEQCQNCLKLMNHINKSQIFYQNTTAFVITHALQVGELTAHLKDVEID